MRRASPRIASAGTLIRDVAQGTAITYDDVSLDETKTIVILRKLQDALLASGQLDALLHSTIA